MAGKGKKKGGKKGKGKRAKAKPKSAVNMGESASFLTLVMVESHRFSAQHYFRESSKAKEDARQLREKLRVSEDGQYAKMRTVLGETEQLAARLAAMEDGQHEFHRKLNINMDPLILSQMDSISKLNELIDQLKADIESINFKILDLNEYDKYSPEAILDEELSRVRAEAEKMRLAREAERDHLIKKHDQSVENTSMRAERIINLVESVASQRELETIPESTLSNERLNRRLKKQLTSLQEESQKYADIITKLESQNMQLVCNNLKIDWNFTYLVPDDVKVGMDDEKSPAIELLGFEELSLEGMRARSADVSSSATQTKPPTLASISQSMTSASSVYDQRPASAFPSSTLDHTDSSNTRLPSIHQNNNALKKRYKAYEIRDLDVAIRKMIQMELEQSRIESERFGVHGTRIPLRQPRLSELGGSRFHS